jgi:hypothetical protein
MVESFVLNTGARIPSVGLGVWQIQPDAAVNAIYAAVKVPFETNISFLSLPVFVCANSLNYRFRFIRILGLG